MLLSIFSAIGISMTDLCVLVGLLIVVVATMIVAKQYGLDVTMIFTYAMQLFTSLKNGAKAQMKKFIAKFNKPEVKPEPAPQPAPQPAPAPAPQPVPEPVPAPQPAPAPKSEPETKQ